MIAAMSIKNLISRTFSKFPVRIPLSNRAALKVRIAWMPPATIIFKTMDRSNHRLYP
jgi:hypothetical protein